MFNHTPFKGAYPHGWATPLPTLIKCAMAIVQRFKALPDAENYYRQHL